MPVIAWQSLKASDADIQSELSRNIVLSGGNTMYTGLPERLKKEINTFMPSGKTVNVIASPDRILSAWKGASIFSSLSSF